jgi:transcription-repair coupling factor (superfamily II helicase)
MFKSIKFYVEQEINIDDIVSELAAFRYSRTKTVIQEGDFSQRGEIIDIFPIHYDSPLRIALDEDHIRSIASFNIKSGKAIWQHNIVIILPFESPRARSLPFSAEYPINHFVDIQKGDYVVHHTHGIGRFLGLTRLTLPRASKDHLVIEYEGGDKLFVPGHDIHLVQKYVCFNKRPPRLFKLGSQEWKRVKALIQKRIQRLAAELLHVQAMRATLKGHQFPTDTSWQKEFEKTFPFQETPDQIKATQDVKADMESDSPMERLLCGDVGFGKTEVALRAAFKAVMDSKQVVVLVPTTILAEQHYYNFTNRLKDFPVKVAMISRFRTEREQAEILMGLKKGTIDIVIGTHRLLSHDVAFHNLGLIIIDEEQRFGVKAKEQLKHLKLLTDVLMMTATPIPRTLYMALTGAKDMSIIATPPQNRIPVATYILEFDEAILKDAMEKELRRKGQVFFLHNRVEDIEKIAKIIIRLVPEARIAVAHGQMPGRILEEVMLKFLKGEIDILVCTSIIESGIDVPNANTMIINRADLFGLADLHQLRGRVGRFSNQSYAYFIIPKHMPIAEIAKRRLKALETYSELGAGFQIAFEDLQIRGAGNLLGKEQSGYISAVGFDLYCRLLKESVEHFKAIAEKQ